MIRSSLLAVACLAPSVLGGCGSVPFVQVETTIRPDGSCERAVWQPRDRMLPAEAFTPAWLARWRKVEDVAVPPAFAATNGNPGEPYFHAVGVFASPADVPPHFRKTIPEHPDLPAGEMTHDYRRRDFGLFVEHRWSETLNNGVTREGFEKAREKFIDLGIPMLVEGVKRVYGRDFDVSAAVAELDRRGRPLFRDLADVWYDVVLAQAAQEPRPEDDVAWREFVAAVERAGVDMRDAGGGVVDGFEAERRLRAFLADRIAATFRHKDGSPTTPDDVRAILGESPREQSFANAWREYGVDRNPDIDAKLLPLLAKMTGPYLFPGFLAPPTPRFAFDVRLPGLIVPAETNGDVDDAGKIAWRFDAIRLFPTAFTMTAASIEIDEPAQRRLLGRVAVADVAAALAVRDLLADDPELIAALRQACETGDPSSLNATPDMEPSRKGRLARLRAMLGMTP